jgi:hypothetical protein
MFSFWQSIAAAVLILALAALGVGEACAQAKDEGYIKVEVKGKLATGIVAIGGETTGTTITVNNVTWELDFGKNEALAKQADQLSGKVVVVTGTLTMKQGVERGPRNIVTVATLKAAGK